MNLKRCLPAVIALVLAAGSASVSAQSASAAAPPVVDGTSQLGACDSLQAVSFIPTHSASFVCVGDVSTDFPALRAAYQSGGMKAVAASVAKARQAKTGTGTSSPTGAVAAASGPTQFTSLVNEKTDAYHWTYSGTVIYGTASSSGAITVYGQFAIKNVISLSGNYAKLNPFYAQRSVGHGSAMKFKLWFWFDITTAGGYWTDTKYSCQQTAFTGDALNCATSGLGYGLYSTDSSGKIVYYNGLGFYGRTKAQWWNQYSPNPSTADGSWTLQMGHGPMDCKVRTQRCQWR